MTGELRDKIMAIWNTAIPGNNLRYRVYIDGMGELFLTKKQCEQIEEILEKEPDV
jgi:hypothetical protein